MDSQTDVQARLLAHEALLAALLVTRNNPAMLHQKFSDLWGETARELGRSAEGNAELIAALSQHANRLERYCSGY
jgi:hypothetical protein